MLYERELMVVGMVGFMDQRLDIPQGIDPMVAAIISDCWASNENKSIANEGVVDTKLSDLTVELGACGGRGKSGTGAEEKGKSEVMELHAGAFHADGEKKSVGRVSGGGGTAYDGVPHEVVRLGYLEHRKLSRLLSITQEIVHE